MKTNAEWIHFRPKSANVIFGAHSLFETKYILGPKYILTQKVVLGENVILSKKCPLELSRTHIPLAEIASGRGRTPKMHFFAHKCILRSKTHFGPKLHFLRKNAFLRQNAFFGPHAADACKTNRF